MARQNAYAEERVISIRELLDVQNKWSLFAENNISFTVRGVIGSRTDAQIHMRKCNLRFLLDSPDSFPRLKPGSKMVKLEGRFQLQGKDPSFRVTKANSEFSLEQVHLQMSVDIDVTDPLEWRKLARYTAAESKFYDNRDLFLVAARSFEHSYIVARTQKGNATIEEITNWVAEMKAFGVPKDALEVWDYERLMLEWRKLQISAAKQSDPFLRFAKEVATKYPVALTPLDVPVPKLEAMSERNSLVTFREADQSQQDRLWRLLYREVMKREILLSAKADGSNADNIRDQMKDAIPDLPDMYLSYDLLWLDWRFSQLSQSGKEEAIKLSAEYRKRKQPERGLIALETWLEKRLELWSQDGASGYVRAAQHYLELLEDKEKAYELLLKAWKLSPGEEETVKALESIGYRLHSGSWILKSNYDKLPPDPIQSAIRNGEVIKGMTASQVERAIGKPEERRFSFSTGHISESWMYGDSQRKRTVVHLLRPATVEGQFAKVIAVGELKPQMSRRDSKTTKDAEE
ncbi:MAG: hypothetical protein P8M30_09195 [Planctomycetaceae bacterium]|nr:hypothetical protein [Planctomycetaceae bacterium]